MLRRELGVVSSVVLDSPASRHVAISTGGNAFQATRVARQAGVPGAGQNPYGFTVPKAKGVGESVSLSNVTDIEAKRRSEIHDEMSSKFQVVKQERSEYARDLKEELVTEEYFVGSGKFRRKRTRQVLIKRHVIGIDLGTTNSCISYVEETSARSSSTGAEDDVNETTDVQREDGKGVVKYRPRVIPSPTGSWVFPTAVTFDKGHQIRVYGEEARACARTSASSTLCSGKRLIGRRFGELGNVQAQMSKTNSLTVTEKGEVAVEVMGRVYSVVHITAMFLRYLKGEAERYLTDKERSKRAERVEAKQLKRRFERINERKAAGDPDPGAHRAQDIEDELEIEAGEPRVRVEVDAAVVSVPAYFTPQQKVATEDAALAAGFDVLEIIDEPSAACLTYTVLSHNQLQDSLNREKEAAEAVKAHSPSTPMTPYQRAALAKKDKKVVRSLVFDLGGGTLDCALMEHNRASNTFTLLKTHGDPMLGGNDWDTVLADQFATNFERKWKITLEDPDGNVSQSVVDNRNLLIEAEKAKIFFTSNFIPWLDLRRERVQQKRDEWTAMVKQKIDEFQREHPDQPPSAARKLIAPFSDPDANLDTQVIYAGYQRGFHFSKKLRDIVPLEATLPFTKYYDVTRILRDRSIECLERLLRLHERRTSSTKSQADVTITNASSSQGTLKKLFGVKEEMEEKEVDYVLLVGAMTRDPPIREALEEYFNGTPTLEERVNEDGVLEVVPVDDLVEKKTIIASEDHCPADYAVAIGAAIRAGMLQGKFDYLSRNTRFIAGSVQGKRSGTFAGRWGSHISSMFPSWLGGTSDVNPNAIGHRWKKIGSKATGLSDTEIIQFAKEMVEFEAAQKRRVLLERAEDEANAIMGRVAKDSSRRQGMQEKRVTQLADQLKFWQYMVHNFHDHEDRLQETVLELKLLLDELDGVDEDEQHHTLLDPEEDPEIAAKQRQLRRLKKEQLLADGTIDFKKALSEKWSDPEKEERQKLAEIPIEHNLAKQKEAREGAGAHKAKPAKVMVRRKTVPLPGANDADVDATTPIGGAEDHEPKYSQTDRLVAAGHHAFKDSLHLVHIPEQTRSGLFRSTVEERAFREPPSPPGEEGGSWKDLHREIKESDKAKQQQQQEQQQQSGGSRNQTGISRGIEPGAPLPLSELSRPLTLEEQLRMLRTSFPLDGDEFEDEFDCLVASTSEHMTPDTSRDDLPQRDFFREQRTVFMTNSRLSEMIPAVKLKA